MVDVVSNINQKIISSITNINFLNIIGWILFIILLIGLGFFIYKVYQDRRIFNKRIVVFEQFGDYWRPAFRDKAKVVKLGTSGFEVLYLKKLKVYRTAYGGKTGQTDYYFFIMPDGYWYNGMLKAGVKYIDNEKGLIPVVTTNPLMRAQYVALEKSIDTLHSKKQSFMEKYGVYVIALSIIVIGGVILWFIARELTSAISSNANLIDKISTLIEKVDIMMKSQQTKPPQGLVPV